MTACDKCKTESNGIPGVACLQLYCSGTVWDACPDCGNSHVPNGYVMGEVAGTKVVFDCNVTQELFPGLFC